MELKINPGHTKHPHKDAHMELLHREISARDIPLRWLTTLLMLVFPATTLFINRGDSYTLGLLSLVGVWVWVRDGARPWLDRHSGMLVLAFALFYAVAVLSYLLGLQTEDGFHYLGRFLRFLLVVPVYLAFRRYPPTTKTAFVGLALGGLVSGVLAMLEFLRAHAPIRVAATTDLSIIFGDLATTVVLCTVAGFGLMAASRRAWSVPLLMLCLAGGIAATLLSGTRGAWLPLLLLPLALMTPLGKFLKHRYVFAIVLVLVAVFSSFYFVAGSGTQERVNLAGKDLRNYFIGLNAFKSQTGDRAGYPRCDSNADFLRVWLRGSYLSAYLKQDTAVVSDPQLNGIQGCMAGYAVHLHNDSDKLVAEAVFHRVPADQKKVQNTQLLVRGQGTASFMNTKQSSASFDTQTYERISLTTPSAFDTAINISVSPGGSVWLVPQDGYFGEYSLSIANTSVGQRLEMWRSAWHLFLTHPVLGTGTGAFEAKNNQLIKHGLIATFVGDYDHPHNDYLNALSSSGIIGLTALLAILILPGWFFMRAVHSDDRVTHALGLAGTLTVAGFAIYALTDTVFLHSMMITWYVIYMALFYALIRVRAEKQNNGAA